MENTLNIRCLLFARPERNSREPGLIPLVRWTAVFGGIVSLLLGSLSLAQAAQSVTLAWDPDTSPVAGYRLHYGTSSGNYTNSIEVGYTTTHTVSNLTAGPTYYF